MEHRRAERGQLRGHGISHKLTACAPIWYPEAQTLISIGRTLTELDRLDNLRQVITACYALALRSTAQYAIEAEPRQAEEFRRHLEALQEKLPAADSPEAVQAVQASFRGELRDYRDKVQEKIGILRKEMEAAAAAMQEFADSVANSGADHEEQVKEQLTRLDAAAASDDLGEIRSGIHTASAGIAASFDQMRRANQLVIAQLRDEIRLLHQQIESERRSLFTDRSYDVWNRQKMDTRIDELFRQNQPFCLLLIFVRNLTGLDSRNSRTEIEGALRALLQRFDALLGEDAMIGRWSEDEFAAILEVDPAAALAFSREAVRKLSGTYSVQENGLSGNVELQVAAGVTDSQSAGDPANFYRRLAQLAEAISGS